MCAACAFREAAIAFHADSQLTRHTPANRSMTPQAFSSVRLRSRGQLGAASLFQNAQALRAILWKLSTC